jgi:hypothetical protein
MAKASAFLLDAIGQCWLPQPKQLMNTGPAEVALGKFLIMIRETVGIEDTGCLGGELSWW